MPGADFPDRGAAGKGAGSVSVETDKMQELREEDFPFTPKGSIRFGLAAHPEPGFNQVEILRRFLMSEHLRHY